MLAVVYLVLQACVSPFRSEEDKRATTNVQNRDSSDSFYYLFFSCVLLELKPFVLKGKVLGEKF